MYFMEKGDETPRKRHERVSPSRELEKGRKSCMYGTAGTRKMITKSLSASFVCTMCRPIYILLTHGLLSISIFVDCKTLSPSNKFSYQANPLKRFLFDSLFTMVRLLREDQAETIRGNVTLMPT